MTTRAINYLRELDKASLAIAAGASLLYVCPADDEAAGECALGIAAEGLSSVDRDGALFARVAPGDAIYTPPVESVAVTYSKLKLRRSLRAVGLESQFEAALDAFPQMRADWTDAVELHSTDPLLTAAMPLFAAALGVPQSAIDALLAEAANG
jgi:hypothetical protein